MRYSGLSASTRSHHGRHSDSCGYCYIEDSQFQKSAKNILSQKTNKTKNINVYVHVKTSASSIQNGKLKMIQTKTDQRST